jgi:hypothetical protein
LVEYPAEAEAWRDGALDGSSLFMRDASPQAVDAREIDSP